MITLREEGNSEFPSSQRVIIITVHPLIEYYGSPMPMITRRDEGNSGFPSSHSIIICDRSCIPTQESLKKYILSVCGSLDYANEIGYAIMFPDTPGECVYIIDSDGEPMRVRCLLFSANREFY